MTTPEENNHGLISTRSSVLVRRMDQRLELVGRLMQEILAKESSRTEAELAKLAATGAISLQGMVQVAAGRLPASSKLGAQSVDSFFIGKTTIIWSEWQTVRTWAATNGYDIGSVGTGNGPNHPVTHVSWFQALKWCNARSEKEGMIPVYEIGADVYRSGDSVPTVNTTANGYRLPSEKEWEFAARGGVKTNDYEFSGSDDLDAVACCDDPEGLDELEWDDDDGDDGDDLDAAAWNDNNSGATTYEVATKQANELGLFDMSGNVLEWCFDLETQDYQFRVARGGSWRSWGGECGVAHRACGMPPEVDGDDRGFRIARSLVP